MRTILVFFIVFFFGAFLLLKSDRFVAFAVHKYIKFKMPNIGIVKVTKIDDKIILNDIYISNSDFTIKISEAIVSYQFVNKSLVVFSNLNRTKLFFKEQEIYDSNFKVDYEFHLLKFTKNIKISSEDKKTICAFKVKGSKFRISNCNLNYDDFKITLDSMLNPNGSYLKTKIKNLSVFSYKTFAAFLPEDVLHFLDNFVLGGKISGDIAIDLGEDVLKSKKIKSENVVANLIIQKGLICCDKDFPFIKDLDAEANIQGSKVKFIVNKGKFGEKTNISDTLVTFDFFEDPIINIAVTGKANGTVQDLVLFISKKNLDKALSQGANLLKASGFANTDFNILIPLDPKIKNVYNITTKITDFQLPILDDRVTVSKGILDGKFDGDSVIFKGQAFVYDFKSLIDYKYDIKKDESGLNAKMTLSQIDKFGNTFKVENGQTTLDLKSINNYIKMSANLTPIDFRIEKLGIHKPIGKKAKIVITTKDPNNLLINVLGEDNLLINGTIDLKNNIFDFKNISYLQANFSGYIKVDQDKVITKLFGKSLDLSNANFFDYLDKEYDQHGADLNINFDEVRLKHDVNLQNLKLHIQCDKVKCFDGSISAKLSNDYSISMGLKAYDDYEQWVVVTDNAGFLLTGLDLYNKIQKGRLMLKASTRRADVKVGSPITIVNGDFLLQKFAMIKTPLLTKIVSFTSLSGLFNILVNKKTIDFDEFKGDFYFTENKIIQIKKGSAEGPYFDFNIDGIINTQSKQMKLKGVVFPSFYGINYIIKKTPIIGNILTQGGRHKIGVFAPFFIDQKY